MIPSEASPDLNRSTRGLGINLRLVEACHHDLYAVRRRKPRVHGVSSTLHRKKYPG